MSYAREDKAKAEALAAVLAMQGWSVWWDRNIPPGRSFDKAIEEALDSARCVIVMWSRFSIASDWVKNEAAEGLRRVILLPILIDDVKIPLEFRRVQTINLSSWSSNLDDTELLGEVVKAVAVQLTGIAPAVEISSASAVRQDSDNLDHSVPEMTWRAELVKRKRDEIQLRISLSQAVHLLEFKMVNRNDFLRLNGRIVGETQAAKAFTGSLDFVLSDGPQRYVSTFWVAQAERPMMSNRIVDCRLTVSGRTIFSLSK